MTLLLNWRVWAAIVLAVALAAGMWKAYVMGENTVRAEWDAVELDRSKAAIRAMDQNLEKERTLKLSQERIQSDLVKERQARVIADGRVADSLVQLRTALAADRGTSEDTATTSGTDDPRDGIIAECAGAYTEVDKIARRLATEKTALQRYASEVCVK